MIGKKWTEAMDARLKALYAEGKSASEIAALFGDGRTRNAIIGRAHRLGLQSSSPAPQAKWKSHRKRQSPGLAHADLIRTLIAKGGNDASISGELGITVEQVRHARRTLQIKSPRLIAERPMSREQAESIRRLAQNGLSDAAIGERLGITHNQVRWLRRKLNIKGNAKGNRGNASTLMKGSAPVMPAAQTPIYERFKEGVLGQVARCDLFSLRDGLCRFPLDRTDGSIGYCGDMADEGCSYCAAHRARCFDGKPMPKPQLVQRSFRRAA